VRYALEPWMLRRLLSQLLMELVAMVAMVEKMGEIGPIGASSSKPGRL